MQTLKSIVRKLCRPLVLVGLGLALFNSTSQAVDFHRWVRVRGELVLIVPECNAWGRVLRNTGYGVPITDRAARGETIAILPFSTVAGEYSLGSYLNYTCGRQSLPPVSLWTWQEFVVSPNPNCDALTYTHCTNYRPNGLTKVIPIGSRP